MIFVNAGRISTETPMYVKVVLISVKTVVKLKHVISVRMGTSGMILKKFVTIAW